MTLESRIPSVSVKSQALVVTTRLNTFELKPGLVVYKLERELQPSGPAGIAALIEQEPQEGIASTASIEEFKAGTVKEISKVSSVVWASLEFLSTARKLGFSTARAFAERTPGHRLRDDVYTAIVEDGLPIEQLIEVSYSTDMLFRLDKSMLPVAIGFDYMSGKMHNEAYDLSAVLAAVKDDSRVTFLRSGSRTTVQPYVAEIPSYNVYEDSARTHCLCFMYGPTDEEALLLWEKMQSYGSQYPSTKAHEAVEALDLLGLNQYAVK